MRNLGIRALRPELMIKSEVTGAGVDEDIEIEDVVVEDYIVEDTRLDENRYEETRMEDIADTRTTGDEGAELGDTAADNFAPDITGFGITLDGVVLGDTELEDARLEDSRIENIVDTTIKDTGAAVLDDATLDAFAPDDTGLDGDVVLDDMRLDGDVVLDETGLDGDIALDDFVLVDAVLGIAVLDDTGMGEELGDTEIEITAIAAAGTADAELEGVLDDTILGDTVLDAAAAFVVIAFSPHSALCAAPMTCPETFSQTTSKALPAPTSSLAALSSTPATFCGGEIRSPSPTMPL